MKTLAGKKVAILCENGFEEIELTSPKLALENAGATVHIISAEATVKGWDHDHWSIKVDRDADIADASPEAYDALMLPGGVMNPDKMRLNKKYVAFAKHFFDAGKPIAAICHAPQLLIETGMLKGRKVTSYPSLQTDLTNAGAMWADKEVVSDRGLVTSRSPKDLPAFNEQMLETFAEGAVHANSERGTATMN